MKKVQISLALVLLVGVPAGAQPDGSSAWPQGGESSLFVQQNDERRCRGQGATTTGQTGLFVLRSAYTVCEGRWQLGAFFNEWDRRVTGSAGNLDRRVGSVAFGYGVSETLEVAAMLPWESYRGAGLPGSHVDAPLGQGGQLNGREFFGEIDTEGAGNFRLSVKKQLLDKGPWAMAFSAFVDLPTGDDEDAVVPGDMGLGAGFDWSVGAWVFNAGVFDPGSPDVGQLARQVHLGIGHGRSLSKSAANRLRPRLGRYKTDLEWITELVSALKIDSSEEHTDIDLTTGGRMRFGERREWAFNFGLRLDLSEGEDTWSSYNPLGGLVGLSWSPRATYRLETAAAGSCRGTVIRDPAGAPCAGDAASEYCCLETVRLIAVPEEPGCVFEAWEGDCTGVEPLTEIKVDADLVCAARFVPERPGGPGGRK